MSRKVSIISLPFVVLAISVLACNAPKPTPSPTVTSQAAPSTPQQKETSTVEPTQTSTVTKSPEATEEAITATVTAEATNPSSTATPTVTSTPPETGEPLVISSPGFEIADWQPLSETGEWEGHLRAIFTGGVAPYTFALENNTPQEENLLYIRWRKCRSAPLTIRVWSADGQEAHKGIWVVSPYCPD